MGRRMDAADSVHMQQVRTLYYLFFLPRFTWEDTAQCRSFGRECRFEISTCGVVIQYVYCSWFTGFSSVEWYLLKVKKEMKDSVRAVLLRGDTLQTRGPWYPASVRLSLSVTTWKFWHFCFFRIQHWTTGALTPDVCGKYFEHINCNVKISQLLY